jgi:hypothetical protein
MVPSSEFLVSAASPRLSVLAWNLTHPMSS